MYEIVKLQSGKIGDIMFGNSINVVILVAVANSTVAKGADSYDSLEF